MPFRVFFRSIIWMSVVAGSVITGMAGCDRHNDVLPDAPPADLADYIEEGMKQWDIPGMAVAVVHNNEIVFAEGFGVRKRGEPEPVDEHTLFGVASITKAFTAAALGMLVDEGLISFDDPIVQWLPDFRLHDPWVTENITIRDALSHRSGLGRMIGNRLQYMTNRERSELIYRLRYLEPEIPFRSGYVYSNMMYLVAGEIIPAVTGKSWDEFVAERFFEPLDMDRSNTSVAQIRDDENAAWPHQEIRGEMVTIPRRNFDNAGPAASINSSVYEMAQWMKLHLGEPGVFNGTRLISEEVMKDLHSSQTVLAENEIYDDLSSYALGWFVQYYRGARIQRHGGGTDGMNTTLILLPEQDLGIIVVANTFTPFRDAVAYTVLDHFMGKSAFEWNKHIRGDYEDNYARQMAERDTIRQMRQDHVPPSLPMERYTGRYYDDLYAELEVMKTEEGQLALRFWVDDSQMADLEHWEGDRFRAVWRNPAQREKFVEFTLGRRAVVEAVEVTFNLRPNLLQVGAYPSGYTRTVRYDRVDP